MSGAHSAHRAAKSRCSPASPAVMAIACPMPDLRAATRSRHSYARNPMRPALVGLVVLLFATPAHAARYNGKRLWATINVCDTARYPDTVGVRASMPGTGTPGEEMFMRFQVQYHSRVDHLWH